MMSMTPNTIPIPWKKTLRGWMLAIGAIAGIVSYGQYSDDENGIVAALVAVVLIWVGASLKTEKKKIAEGGLYN